MILTFTSTTNDRFNFSLKTPYFHFFQFLCSWVSTYSTMSVYLTSICFLHKKILPRPDEDFDRNDDASSMWTTPFMNDLDQIGVINLPTEIHDSHYYGWLFSSSQNALSKSLRINPRPTDPISHFVFQLFSNINSHFTFKRNDNNFTFTIIIRLDK